MDGFSRFPYVGSLFGPPEPTTGASRPQWDAMGFGLLETDVADEVCIGDSVILGDLGFFDEEYCSSAFNLFGGGARDAEVVGEESTPFIGEGAFPDGCVGTAKELGKGALFSGCW